MLLSLKERVGEIGIRRAVGARRKDILVQFLVEASFLGVMGGLLGVLAGALTAELIRVSSGMPVVTGAGLHVPLPDLFHRHRNDFRHLSCLESSRTESYRSPKHNLIVCVALTLRNEWFADRLMCQRAATVTSGIARYGIAQSFLRASGITAGEQPSKH